MRRFAPIAMYLVLLVATSSLLAQSMFSGRGFGPPMGGNTYRHPSGYFSFTLPAGWSVAQEVESALYFNPGVTPGVQRDGVAALFFGLLPANQRRLTPAQLIQTNTSFLLNGLQQQGIQAQPMGRQPVPTTFGGATGATVTWPAVAQGRQGQVYIGLIAKDGFYIMASGAMVAQSYQRYVAALNTILESLRSTAPKRNQAAEAALAGRSCAATTYTRSGSAFHAVYRFHPGNRVVKTLSSSGKIALNYVSSDNDSPGTYEVYDQVLFMTFQDGPETGKLTTNGQGITGFAIGNAQYSMY